MDARSKRYHAIFSKKPVLKLSNPYLQIIKLNLTYWPIVHIIKVSAAIGFFYAFFLKDSEWFILVIGIVVALLLVLSHTKNY
tara:strand:+ start:61 stop:306 length:246 start_codon:yes stop_codon:yes gene_type:complete